jgi:hypothetical protein
VAGGMLSLSNSLFNLNELGASGGYGGYTNFNPNAIYFKSK